MTYSSYLVHFPMQLVIVLGCAKAGIPVPFYNGLFFAIFVTSTFLISYFTYRYFEAPAQTFLRNNLLPGARMVTRTSGTALMGRASPSEAQR
jgi:peptidoglycan/LPS O-acetylase OafA/YrhL